VIFLDKLQSDSITLTPFLLIGLFFDSVHFRLRQPTQYLALYTSLLFFLAPLIVSVLFLFFIAVISMRTLLDGFGILVLAQPVALLAMRPGSSA
jgi:hypothetical protein